MNQVAKVSEPQILPAPTPMELLDRAVQGNATPDTLAKLMDLQERWEKNEARKAFDNAMSAAKAEIPVIHKNKSVSFGQGKTAYGHEDMAEIARTIDPILSKHGLSYRFRTATEAGKVSVTCIISHRGGGSEENTLDGPPDNSGSKNSLQAIGSTVTYLQRYTLKAALGLAASADDDAKAAGAEPITDAQADEIRALVNETKVNLDRFLKFLGAESIADIPAKQFADAIAKLESKRA